MEKGIIQSLNDKGFGFLKVEKQKSNVFFHAKDLQNARFDELNVGDELFFTHLEKNEKGQAAKGLELA